jgi:hypothetical protein
VGSEGGGNAALFLGEEGSSEVAVAVPGRASRGRRRPAG